MRRFLLLIFVAPLVSSYAQCVKQPKKHNRSKSISHNAPLMYNEMERGKDFSGNYTIDGLKIGGGITNGLLTSGLGQISSSREAIPVQWDHNKLGGFVEAIYQLNTRRNISFGFSVNWTPLWKRGESFTTQPVYPQSGPGNGSGYFFGPEQPAQTLYALQWSQEKAMKSNSLLLFSDLELFRFNRRIDLFIRPEIGIANYKSIVTIKAEDTCNCNQVVSRITDRKTSLTGGLSLGVNLNYRYVEFKSMLGYRIYNMIGFSSPAYFSQWRTEFDETSYDFKGGRPAASLFTIHKPEDAQFIGKRTGVFYLQVGVYLNLGELLN